MLGGLSSALSGMRASSKRLQGSANNLVNVVTSGFKSSQIDQVPNKNGGTRVSATSINNSQGFIAQSSDPLSLAISGRGFFQVTLNNGETAFTRAGSFKLDGGGRLVNLEGNPVVPEITIPGNATNISITSGGEVSISVDGETRNVGLLELADFNNPGGLAPLGKGLFGQTAASGAPIGSPLGEGDLGTILSGAVELSNVDISSEKVYQITSAAAFKANAQVIKAVDGMTGSLLDIKA